MRDIAAACCQLSINPGDVDEQHGQSRAGTFGNGGPKLPARGLSRDVVVFLPLSGASIHGAKDAGNRRKAPAHSSRHDIVIAGSLPECDGGTIFNTNYVVDSYGGNCRKI